MRTAGSRSTADGLADRRPPSTISVRPPLTGRSRTSDLGDNPQHGKLSVIMKRGLGLAGLAGSCPWSSELSGPLDDQPARRRAGRVSAFGFGMQPPFTWNPP